MQARGVAGCGTVVVVVPLLIGRWCYYEGSYMYYYLVVGLRVEVAVISGSFLCTATVSGVELNLCRS